MKETAVITQLSGPGGSTNALRKASCVLPFLGWCFIRMLSSGIWSRVQAPQNFKSSGGDSSVHSASPPHPCQSQHSCWTRQEPSSSVIFLQSPSKAWNEDRSQDMQVG